MIGYSLRRVAVLVPMLIGMSVLVFLATHALPSNAAALMLGQAATPDSIAALETKLGLDLPLAEQYWRWADGILHGDLGQSLLMERPVAPIVWSALGRSAVLAATSMAMVAMIGPALGVLAAAKAGRWQDHLATCFAYLSISLPDFFWGLVLVILFGSVLHWLPTSGAADLADGLLPFAAHLVLPVSTLVLSLLARVSRLTRSSMVDTLASPYADAARARGLPERTVVLRHALPNALLPTVTALAQDFGIMMGGVVAVEAVFAYPGLGRLLVFSLEHQDLPTMQAAILVLTAIYCVANLLADLAYGLLDPRIRHAA